MRNEITVDKLGKPVMNKVLVEVQDTFDEFKSKGGIDMINCNDDLAWADSPEYNISEFAIRHGTVVDLPDVITCGSFDYNTQNELEVGDIAFWNLISFKDHVPLVCGDKKYLLVDYHEILVRIRNNEILPINGNVSLAPVAKEDKLLEHTIKSDKSMLWKILMKPKQYNVELNPRNEFTDIWEVGDIVYLTVYDAPFQIEGVINNTLDVKLYACPLRYVLCSTKKLLENEK